MIEGAQLLDRVMRDDIVDGAALFSPNRAVVQRGLQPGGDLAEIATTVRHVFRETHPAVRVVELVYPRIRVLLLPAHESVLMLIAHGGNLASLMATVEAATAEMTSQVASPRAAVEVAPTAPEPLAPVEALNAVLAVVRGSLGGPVIRNYLKSAQKTLGNDLLEPAVLGLDGRVTWRDPADRFDPKLARAVGVWLRAFLERCKVVAPALGSIDLRAATGDIGRGLEPHGFFDA